MTVYGAGNVFGTGTELNGQYTFGDHVRSAGSDDVHPQETIGFFEIRLLFSGAGKIQIQERLRQQSNKRGNLCSDQAIVAVKVRNVLAFEFFTKTQRVVSETQKGNRVCVPTRRTELFDVSKDFALQTWSSDPPPDPPEQIANASKYAHSYR